MKKYALLPALLFCVCTLLGQNKWSFGLSIQGGFSGEHANENRYTPNAQFGDYSYLSEKRLQPSFGGGFWLERRLGKRWSSRLGLEYVSVGSFSRSTSTSYTLEGAVSNYSRYEQQIRQEQLLLPLEIHYYLGQENRRWRPYLSVGTQLQYLLSQHAMVGSTYDNGGLGTETYEYAETVDFNTGYYDVDRWEIGFNAAIGFASDQISASLGRNWTRKRTDNYYLDYNYYGDNILINYPCDYYVGGRAYVRQLQQLSFRLQYKL